MSLSNTSSFLRRVLLVDAAISGTTGLLMAFGANRLNETLEVPAALLRYAGLSLLPFAALLIYLARRESLSRPIVWTIIIANALWAIDSILILLLGWVEPNTLGYAFIVAQALVVAVFAGAQHLGLRKLSAVTA